jgi:protein-S-isoprenylcysteine O-methyltransferase Ste14
MEQFLKIFLPIYFVTFIAAAFGYRIYITWKRTGVKPYFLGRLDSLHGIMGVLISIGILSCLAIALIFSFSPSLYQSFSPIAAMQRNDLNGFGVFLLLISLAWIIFAQAQMGASWRIGVDESKKTDLVTTGVFRLSRNPIYLGMAVTLIGLFLVLPTSTTLGLLIGGIAIIHLQILLEEQDLRKKHGQAFTDYTKKVRRWI